MLKALFHFIFDIKMSLLTIKTNVKVAKINFGSLLINLELTNLKKMFILKYKTKYTFIHK